jgi:hypothetical protein
VERLPSVNEILRQSQSPSYCCSLNLTYRSGKQPKLLADRNCWWTDRRRTRRGAAWWRRAGRRRSTLVRGRRRRERASADGDRAGWRPNQLTRIASYWRALATYVWRRGTRVFRRSGRTVIQRIQFARVRGRHVSCRRDGQGQYNAH